MDRHRRAGTRDRLIEVSEQHRVAVVAGCRQHLRQAGEECKMILPWFAVTSSTVDVSLRPRNADAEHLQRTERRFGPSLDVSTTGQGRMADLIYAGPRRAAPEEHLVSRPAGRIA